MDEVLSLLAGPPSLYHAHLEPWPPAVALTSATPQVTEFVTVYFPTNYSPEDQKTFDDGIRKFGVVVEGSAQGFLGAVAGWVEEELDLPDSSEKAKAYILLIGWKSVQAHLDYRETQVFKDNIHYLRGAKDLKTLKIFHVPVKEVKRA